ARRLPYLHALGVDWVYLSPLLEAEPGSDHGYDVVAHDRIDPTRGGAEGLAALSAEARRLGMGVLVDIVPNHVGIATPSANAWWWDVLTHGQESRYAEAFDIDWDAGDGKILVPVVGDGDEDAITVDVEAGEVRYHEHRFPLAPRTRSLDKQHYRLVSWRAADDSLNYRRFFAVNTLAAVRVEEPWVFDETHVEIKRWFAESLVDGLRVDHPDGLRDPEGYLRDLASATDGAYVLVEKILEPGETLPSTWATAGTTGYDALALVDRVLTAPFSRGDLPHDDLDWEALIHRTKRTVADTILSAEIRRIVRELPGGAPAPTATLTRRLAARLRGSRPTAPVGFPAEQVIDAVAELAACFPVYRSYLPHTRGYFDEAFTAARKQRPDLAPVLEALAPVLGDAEQPAALRFQQTSGMVMAKGVEDCAFYRYNALTSLNEVGGDPSQRHLPVEGFHLLMATRQRDRADAMTCTSTHDTKRGEDVRARIAVLAECPDTWTSALARLQDLAPVPDGAFATLLWQAILGAWDDVDPQDPDLRTRLHAYAEKAMREAGDHTTWTAPDETYESTVHAAVDAAFDSPEVAKVLRELLDLVVEPGRSNALSAKLVALTIPGVPDVYQGSELWEQSLVDPDNRRPVDFDLRARLLGERHPDHSARGKLATTTAALHLRRDHAELFTAYEPVAARGDAAEHLIAFDRGGAVTLATRLPLTLARSGGWGETELVLPAGRWWDHVTDRDLESDGTVLLSEVLDVWPVALLTRADDEDDS
ncbi:malto-oligosyltrehalose synthase, partial [Nocardioides sp.]|uniref:malto-oligosyltrehalose synthase n=1 Tax=Nocardioides sp. TaxID=35761 RepID=UPI002B269E2A